MPKTDIVLVNPNDKKRTYGKLAVDLAGIEPPLWHALLAAYLREQGFSVRIIDADAEGWGPEETVAEIVSSDPLLVSVGAIGTNPSAATTPKMTAVRLVLEDLFDHQTSFLTMLYGIHPAALPERTFQEEKVDFICRGETFYPVSQLLKILKASGPQADYDIKGLCYRKGEEVVLGDWADVVENLDDLPMAAWDLLPMEKYRAHNWHCFDHIHERSPYAMIYTSLGCPFNCEYCNIHALYGGKPGIRYRDPQNVLAEIDHLVKNYHVKNIKFLDELFVINRGRLLEVCDLLISRGYGLNIWAYARIDTVDEDILKKLRQAGILWLCYGIEAASQDVRGGVNKGRFDKEKIKNVVRMTQAQGIRVLGNFMFGLPDDTMDSMRETLDLAKELKCDYANFYTTMAYPGSKLYEDTLASGIPLPDSWKGFSQYSPDTRPLPTKYVSAREVLRFRDDAFEEYFSDAEYQAMIEEKFGADTLEHIKRMLEHKLSRKILEEDI